MGFFEDYLAYTKHQKSPEVFHFFAALSILSCAASRNYYTDYGYYKIYPNLYIMLVAPSGRCAKTVSIDIALNFLRDCGIGDRIFCDSITREALSRKMHGLYEKHKVADPFVVAPELSTFLSQRSKDTDLLAFITRAYDCGDVMEYRTKNMGEDVFKNVWMGILGGTAPEWIPTFLPPGLVGGGTISRFIMVYKEKSERIIPRAKLPEGHRILRNNIVSTLAKINTNQAEYKWDEGAIDFFDKWYYENEMKLDSLDARFRGYYNRKPTLVIQIAMLYDLSHQNPKYKLTISNLKFALGALNAHVDPHLWTVYAGLTASQSTSDDDRILQKGLELQGRDPIGNRVQWRDLYNYLHAALNADQIKRGLARLERGGYVKATGEKAENGRLITYYQFFDRGDLQLEGG